VTTIKIGRQRRLPYKSAIFSDVGHSPRRVRLMFGGNPQAPFWTAALALIKQAYLTAGPIKVNMILL